MLFAGDQDFICNYIGIEALIADLTWGGSKGFPTESKPQTWSVDGTVSGEWTSGKNLTYVRVYNASHMAPYDIPHVSHDMILRFVGLNFSAAVDGTAKIPSEVGGVGKVVWEPHNALEEGTGSASGGGQGTKNPEQDKAMWEGMLLPGLCPSIF